MRVLNGRESLIGLAGEVVVPVRRSVAGRSTLTNWSTRCIYAIRRSVDAEVIEGAEREEVSDR